MTTSGIFRVQPPAPSGEDAFGVYVAVWKGQQAPWLVHPAIQQSMQDVHGLESPSVEPVGCYPAAFARNYEKYHLLRWNSNIEAQQQMLRDFPVTDIQGYHVWACKEGLWWGCKGWAVPGKALELFGDEDEAEGFLDQTTGMTRAKVYPSASYSRGSLRALTLMVPTEA